MSAITAKARRKMKKYAVLTREPRCFLGSFDFSWEQRKLGDIADIVGGGTPSTGNPNYWDGDIDWYAPAEIASQIYANSSQKKITDLGYENSSAKMLPPGTVLFTSRAGIGKTAILTRKGCTNQGFQSIVPHRGELDSYFIFSRTEELKRYGELVGAGSTFVEVSGKQMAVMELMMPPTMREQQTIGGFFQQLDHLITLHQRKCALLFSSFQALISMMFTTSTFSWEQRKFGDIASDMVAGGDIDKDLILAEGQYPVIANALTGDGIVGYYDKEYRVNAPAVTVTGRGDVGHAKARLVNFTPVVRLLSVKSEHDVFFLENAINTLKIVIESTGVPQLTVPQLAKYEVAFPRQLDEEEHIGAFFKHLDHLITLHQRKCISFTGRAGRLISTVNKKRITSSWEQRKLGELIRLNGRIGFRGYTEKDIVSKDDGGVLAFSPTNIVDNKLTTNCKNTYITRFKYDESPEIKIHNGDILFVKTGSTLGKSALVTGLLEDATLNPQVVVMRTNKADAEFLAAMLITNHIISQVNSAKIGGAVPTLTETRIKDFDVAIPASEVEKEQIGQFFTRIDNLITLHQRKPFLMKWRTSDANRNQTNRLVL